MSGVGYDKVPAATYRLVLLRHGESEWNEQGLFTGWTDVGLSRRGEHEAAQAGELLRHARIPVDVVHTSLLRRAIRTAEIALEVADRQWVPVRRSWRLNERHYGALQGKNKAETRALLGDEQFMLWRRSFDVPPPPEVDSQLMFDPRYRSLPPEVLPSSECLKDVLARVLPYWEDAIVPDLRADHVVLVAAHGNSLRALVKHLDVIADDAIAGLNIPTGIPLVYELDHHLRSTGGLNPTFGVSGRYLDEQAASRAIEEVRAQGSAAPTDQADAGIRDGSGEPEIESASYLRERRGGIIGAAESTLSKTPGRYAGAGSTTRGRIESLFDGLVDALARRDGARVIAHARQIAGDRFRSGYDLSEVQTAFNALEEAIWSDVFEQLPPEQYAAVLSDTSTVLGGAKDALAREYVLLATGAHAPAVDMEALARGVESS